MAIPVPRLSVEQFFEIERRAEYHDGEVFPLEGVTLNHSRVDIKLASVMHRMLQGKECREFRGVHVRATATHYPMPDLVVVCGKPQLAGKFDAITNPKVIFEILSPSTADYDQGSKFGLYRNMESFVEYVVLAQDRPTVQVFRKANANEWTLTLYDGVETTFPIASLGVELSMKELYADVEFSPEPDQS